MGSHSFNPVDLVCGIKITKRKVQLKDFVDPDSGFIVEKNTAGKYKSIRITRSLEWSYG
jgi:hypothetical protein